MDDATRTLEDRQKIEIDFWRDDPNEKPGIDSLDNFLDKAADAWLLRECLRPYESYLRQADSALELGAGQGWASCLIKRLFPALHVTTTDISPFAVASIPRWERLYGVQIDRAEACRSYELPVADQSVDFVFCFAAAHHFVAHRRTLAELRRVLKPGGLCVYFYEPTCPRWLYGPSVKRVNRKRPDVPEDVLIRSEIKKLSSEVGLDCRIRLWPSSAKRGRMAGLYYSAVSVMGPLKWMMPCTAHFEFRKPLVVSTA